MIDRIFVRRHEHRTLGSYWSASIIGCEVVAATKDDAWQFLADELLKQPGYTLANSVLIITAGELETND